MTTFLQLRRSPRTVSALKVTADIVWAFDIEHRRA